MPRRRDPGLGIALAIAAAVAAGAAGAQPSGSWGTLNSGASSVLNPDTDSFFLTGLYPTVTIDDVVFFGRALSPSIPGGQSVSNPNAAAWLFMQGTGAWVAGFDPYSRVDPAPTGTLDQTNADLLAAWRALTSPFPQVCVWNGECGIGSAPRSAAAAAQMTWYVLASLVTTSCSGEDGVAERPECFAPGQSFAPDRCSFHAAHLCASVEDALAAVSLVPLRDLQLDRVRVHTRRSRARARLTGSYVSDAQALESRDGSFSVVLGDFAASIPLSEFRRKHYGLEWRSHGPGLRVVKLFWNGRFTLLVRGIESSALAYDELPLLLRVGNDVGGTWIPLE